MNIAGFGASLTSLSSSYNFRNMTNKEFLDTVVTLGKTGRISQSDADQLSMIAQGVDRVPISGAAPSVAEVLSDPDKKDFIAELEGNAYSAHRPGAIGGAMCDHMLKALKDICGDTPYESSNF